MLLKNLALGFVCLVSVSAYGDSTTCTAYCLQLSQVEGQYIIHNVAKLVDITTDGLVNECRGHNGNFLAKTYKYFTHPGFNFNSDPTKPPEPPTQILPGTIVLSEYEYATSANSCVVTKESELPLLSDY
jgi:hypothetical protein